MDSPMNHFDEAGNAVMVDVSAKPETSREAVARGRIQVSPEVFAAISQGCVAKGDVLGSRGLLGLWRLSAPGN